MTGADLPGGERPRGERAVRRRGWRNAGARAETVRREEELRAERELRAEGESRAEEELRALLEHAVPRLPAPAERLTRVRDRVVRRRRHRAAAGSVAGMAVLTAAAGLLLPGVLSPQDAPEGIPPAGSSADPLREVRYPDLGGLTVRVPQSWYTTSPPGGWDAVYESPPDGGEDLASPPNVAVGFASSQPFESPLKPCAATDDSCLLVHTLRPGGILLTFSGPYGGLTVERTPTQKDPVSLSCRSAGGDREISALVNGPYDGQPAQVLIAACLARPTGVQLQQVQDIIATAHFDDSAVPAPNSVRD